MINVGSTTLSRKVFEKPRKRDIKERLILMKEHATQNGVLEIHRPRLAAGLDGIN